MKDNSIHKNLALYSFFNIFSRMGNAYLSQQYAEYQLSHGHHQFLIALYVEDGITQDELRSRLSVDKVATARAVDKLQQAGYVQAVVDAHDRRYRRVFLTPLAHEKRDEILHVAEAWQDTLLHNLTTQDKALLTQLCKKILEEKP